MCTAQNTKFAALVLLIVFLVLPGSISGNVINNNGGHIENLTIQDGDTFNNSRLYSEVDVFNMLGGIANNEGWIGHMTYSGGTYNYLGGTIGTLNLSNSSEDARGFTNWGTVNNLAFSSDSVGFLTINGFADGGDFIFSGINVLESVNLANANVQMNLYGSVNDWLGLSSWDNVFGGTRGADWGVTGWEDASFKLSWWEDELLIMSTDWLAYGDTWSWEGYVVEFGANGMSANVVPEPATLAMIGLGLAGLGYARRRQTRKTTAA